MFHNKYEIWYSLFEWTVFFQLTGDIRGFRVGLVKEGFNPEFESDVNELVRKSAKQLISIGAVVEEVSIPWHSNGKHMVLITLPRDI